MATAASRLLQLLLCRPATRRISAQPRACLSSTPSSPSPSPSTGVQLLVEEEVQGAAPSHEVRAGNPPMGQKVVVEDVVAEALLGVKAPQNPSPQPRQTDGQYKHNGVPPAAGRGGGSHNH